MAEYTDGVPNVAEDTELAKGVYADFFERNKEGITHVNYQTRTYYIRRTWTLKGPIPRGTRVEHVGLANNRRAAKVKRGRRR